MSIIEHPTSDLPPPHKFTREQYYRMDDLGFFNECKVELIAGDVLDKFPDTDEHPFLHRFSRDEYYAMADQGFFENQRVELIEGVIVDMAPQKNPHYLAINMVSRALAKAFGEESWIRQQGPLRMPDNSEPEPDVSVVPGPMESYKDHPTRADLVVEISSATLRFDRGTKAALYAKAGVEDYWIVNLVGRCVEVFRNPTPDAAAPGGYRFQTSMTFRPGQTLSPLAKAGAQIPVADLLP